MILPLAALASALLGAADAPITAVTVYSDRARVTRTASISAQGRASIELPLLLESVDPATIRVEGVHAEVRRVDIAYLDAEAFPADQAQALLAKIQKVSDEITETAAQDDAYRLQLATFQRLTPQPEKGLDPTKPPPKLTPAGWPAVVAFSVANQEKIEAHRRELHHHLEDLGGQQGELIEEARLLGGAQRSAGYRVTVTVGGHGSGSLLVTYMVNNARWYPSYDVSLAPEQGQVHVAFAGLVSQESGEDWSDASLTLSTAIPASALVFPKLLTWKIGEKERFIPTPVAAAEPPPPPIAEPPRALNEARLEDDLRQQLAAVAMNGAPEAKAQAHEDEKTADKKGVKTRKKSAVDLEDATIDRDLLKADSGGRAANYRSAPGKPAPPEAPKPEPMMAPPPPPAEVAISEQSVATSAPGAALDYLVGGKSGGAAPSSELGIAPPPAYLAPQFAANLPAALAGGYDLSFPSLRRETVKSGAGARRVALFAQQWPVTVEREVFPALNPEAFLIAELASPSATPLPGGTANLFVGADPAGVAQLKLVSPGERFTLPLGLDRGLRPIRNVTVVEAEKGLISKDEVTEYAVTTEIANPYPTPLAIRVFDQWPLTDQKDVEIHLLKTEPFAKQDPVKGSLEWRIAVPPRGKATPSFTYSIRRPKGWRMHQQ